MKANRKFRMQRGDEGVSPVIAVILMVAITVVLAATVYVWVTGLSSQEEAAENASVRASTIDINGNGSNDWLVFTLTQAANAPFDASVITFTVLNATGSANPGDLADRCEAPNLNATSVCDPVANAFIAGDTWAVGGSIYIPCDANEFVRVSLRIKNTAVLDNVRLDCDENAT